MQEQDDGVTVSREQGGCGLCSAGGGAAPWRRLTSRDAVERECVTAASGLRSPVLVWAIAYWAFLVSLRGLKRT